MDRAVVQNQHHRCGDVAGPGTIEPIELLEMGDEVTAAFGRAGMDDELACDVIERAQHRDFLGLPWRWHTQVVPCLCPDPGEIGMAQRLTLIAIEENTIAGFGLLFAQPQAQPDPFDLGADLASLQRVPWPPPTELFCAMPWTIASG